MQEAWNRRSLQLSRLVVVLFASAILLVMPNFMVASAAAQNGPRGEDLVISFYDSQESAYAALTTGDIDLMLYDLTISQTDNAFTNPNLVTCKVPDSGFCEFDLNNNYTIKAYPGIRSPMNYSEMRKAVAFLSDKDFYVKVWFGTKAARIDQMVAAPYYGWANESWSYPHYPYEYSPAAAKAMLDSRFPVGTTPNPYYDASNPLSSAYIRQYPVDHPQKAGQDLDPLIFYVRVDHPPRLHSGSRVYHALQMLGVPIDARWWAAYPSYPEVMGEFNYHIYTGAWSVGRFPPLTLYSLYHSVQAYPYGSNYVTGNGTHPYLDDLLYNANYAANYSDAVKYTKLALGYMTEICVNIPLWSPATYWGWSNKLLGVVNMQGDDPASGYSFLNAYKQDGSVIRCGAINPPYAMNIIYSTWIYDYSNLDRMNLYSGVTYPAYNTALDMGGFVRDWETTAWNDNGTLKTKLVMAFRSDGYFVKPVSGDPGRNVNATHYYINAWYRYQTDDCFFHHEFINLHHVDITGTYDFEAYFNTLSYWDAYCAQPALLPVDTWAEHAELITKQNETFVDPVTPGSVPTAEEEVWFTSVTFNGTPLTLGADYNIVSGQLHIYNALGPGTLHVEYWAVGEPRGYTPGNLPWQTIFEGAGMYYCTSFTPGVGGSATYKRNPFYYMETPPLGEVDFVRKQVDGKPIGPHKVDIFDLAVAGAAFGSQGTGIPSSNWVPGADVAPSGGVIDILDLVTVTGVNWDREFDPPE